MAPSRLLVAVVVLFAACHRGGAPRPLITGIEVVDRSPTPVASRDDLRSAARQALAKTGMFEVVIDKPPPSGAHTWRCRVESAAGSELAAGEGVLHAMARVSCGPVGDTGAETLTAQALGDQPHKTDSGAPEPRLRTLALRLLDDTIGLLARQQRLRTGPVPELVAALGDADADVRRQAVRAAAYRRARETVPALIALLDDSESDLRDMALGALADLGDPRAVGPLTKRVKFSERDDLRKIIDPVGTMGGPEARAFLEFVASGHEDPDIRRQAHSALERLDRRAQAQAPTSPTP
jgi:hypothetical protein